MKNLFADTRRVATLPAYMAKHTLKAKKEFAKLVRDWRERKGLSQSEAAERLDISVNTLQNWEIARNMPQGFAHNELLKKFER